jgi:glycosyltransferase involved in cell wall biosynthesis
MLLFAKTHWLCNVVGERHGLYVAKVEPSLDEALYRPRPELPCSSVPRVAAMIRPRTPRRQPFATVHVLQRLLTDFGGAVEVVTFGCDEEAFSKITRGQALGAQHRGMLDRDDVAELLATTDVFLDMSMYQAFGRTALEAMACGATAVVPQIGGVWEFAVHDENALIVDTLDRDATYTALAGLVRDPDRLARLRANAIATAARYSIIRAALSEYLAFDHAYNERRASMSQ